MLKLYEWKVIVSVKKHKLTSGFCYLHSITDLTLVHQYFKEFTFKKQTPFVHTTKFLSYRSQE